MVVADLGMPHSTHTVLSVVGVGERIRSNHKNPYGQLRLCLIRLRRCPYHWQRYVFLAFTFRYS